MEGIEHPVPLKGEAATIPMLSQGVEVFIVFIEHNGNEINPHQFGSFEGSSTSCRLIDLLRNWLLTVPECYLRACVLDHGP